MLCCLGSKGKNQNKQIWECILLSRKSICDLWYISTQRDFSGATCFAVRPNFLSKIAVCYLSLKRKQTHKEWCIKLPLAETAACVQKCFFFSWQWHLDPILYKPPSPLFKTSNGTTSLNSPTPKGKKKKTTKEKTRSNHQFKAMWATH